MASIYSMDPVDSNVFFVEQLSKEPSPQPNNSPNILNWTELPGTHAIETPEFSSVSSPKPYVITLDDLDDDLNDPTFPYEFGTQQPIVPPTLNDLSLPPNSFNILAIMAVVSNQHDINYSPQSPEPSEPSPISTRPMNVSTFATGTRFTRRRMTIRSTLMMNPEGFIFCHQPLSHHRHREK